MKLRDFFAGCVISNIADQYTPILLSDKEQFDQSLRALHDKAYQIADALLELNGTAQTPYQ